MRCAIARRLWLVAFGLAAFSAAAAAAQENEAVEDPRLVTIGSLGASYVYTTYGYIGLVADGFAEEQYDAAAVQEHMRVVMNIADVNAGQFQNLLKTDLNDEDRRVVRDMLEITGLLKRQAAGLVKYSQTKAPQDATAFEKTRTTVWPKIAALLGIDQPEDKDQP